MSPEVLRGDGYDFKSDIWSLGCLLYELTMLKSPFKAEGLNLYSLFQKISQGDYQPLPLTYSEDLRCLAYLMISTKSEDRPEIATACVKASALRLSTSNSRKPSLEPIITENIDDKNLKDPESVKNRIDERSPKGHEGEKSGMKGNRLKSFNLDVKEEKFDDDEKEMDRKRGGEEKNDKNMRNNGNIRKEEREDEVFMADKNMEIDIKMNFNNGINNQKKNGVSHIASSSKSSAIHKNEKSSPDIKRQNGNSESSKPLHNSPNFRSKSGQIEYHDAPDTDSTENSHINTHTRTNTHSNTHTNRDSNRDRQNSENGNGNSKIRNSSSTKTTENTGRRSAIERNKGFDLADNINPVLYE